MLQHAIVSLFAELGLSLGKPADQASVLALIEKLHPVAGGHELIRLGDEADGGYLVPDDLDGITACFSPGVDDRATFETALADRGMACFLADGTVAGSPVDHPLISFTRKNLGVVNDDHMMTLDAWVEQCAPADGDLLLQMDIEGAEVPVLLNVSAEVLARFRIVVIELHFLDRLFDREYFTVLSAMLGRLMEHFAVVHNHPNNFGGTVRRRGLEVPRVQELTLLRRDRVRDWTRSQEFPHPLDVDNAEARPKVVLRQPWHA